MMLFQTDSKNFEASKLLVLHLLLTPFCRGQFQLIGSSQPIVAALGDDIILPCHLEPSKDVTAMTLVWSRPNLNPRYVYVHRSGQELKVTKHRSLKGRRTSVFINELKSGNISLKVSGVKLSDQGTYICYIKDLDREASVQLVVGAASSPLITKNQTTRGLDLQCESRGWYPEPELLWLDSEGDLLPAGPPETLRGPDDLYTVSSRVTVEKRSSSSCSITCRVQQKETNQTRDTQILVPEEFCHNQQHPADAYLVSGWVILAVFIIAILIFSLRRRNQLKTNCKGNKKKPSPTIDIHKGWTVPEKELSLIKVIQQDSYIGAPLTGRLEVVVQPMNLVYI